jgi:hypothetical protein
MIEETDEQGPGIVINQAQDSKPDVDPESITQTFGGTTGGTGGGGGADASRSDFPTGGGNVVIGGTTGTTSGPAGRGFTPVQRETQRISDIMDRRRRGSSQGFNAGGLSKYTKVSQGQIMAEWEKEIAELKTDVKYIREDVNIMQKQIRDLNKHTNMGLGGIKVLLIIGTVVGAIWTVMKLMGGKW